MQDIGCGLGETVTLRERHPVIGPRLLQLDRHGRSPDERQAQRRRVGRRPVAVGREHRVLGRHAHHRRHTSLGDQLQGPCRLERALQYHRRTDPPREERLAVPSGDVELRQDREHDVVLGEGQRLGEREVVPEAVRVREHDPLRSRLAARREDDEQRIVVVHVARDTRRPRRRHQNLDAGRAERGDRRHVIETAQRLPRECRMLVLDEHQRGRRAREHVDQFARA